MIKTRNNFASVDNFNKKAPFETKKDMYSIPSQVNVNTTRTKFDASDGTTKNHTHAPPSPSENQN
jgi:hypothetical protein